VLNQGRKPMYCADDAEKGLITPERKSVLHVVMATQLR